MSTDKARGKILIVDDVELNRVMLAAILKEEFPILMADGGRQAIEQLEEHHDEIAVVLLDLIMADMDGYDVLMTMKERAWMEKIPVLVISAESKVDVERKCYELGVSDFIHKPFDNAIVKNRVNNIVELFRYKNDLEAKVEKQTEALKKKNKLLAKQAEKLKESNTQIIDILGTVVEFRNLESGEHIKRVKGFTKILADRPCRIIPNMS